MTELLGLLGSGLGPAGIVAALVAATVAAWVYLGRAGAVAVALLGLVLVAYVAGSHQATVASSLSSAKADAARATAALAEERRQVMAAVSIAAADARRAGRGRGLRQAGCRPRSLSGREARRGLRDRRRRQAPEGPVMRKRLLALMPLIGLALGACAKTPAPDLTTRPALPPVPADLAACFARAFPEIPDAAFGRAAAVRIIANAKLLDRAKTACGTRALAWIADVQREYGRH